MTSLEELVPVTGFLTDRQITAAVLSGFLLDEGSWNPAGVRHASYTLRLGDRVEIARAAVTAGSETKEFSVVRLQTGDKVDLRPGDTALLYSIEHLRLPNYVLGFTVARGLLYAEALAPENTYVDPGFTGQLYTTVTNVSNRVVYLEYGMPVARLFFFRLSEPAENGYRAGSAMGIAQQLRSVRAVALATPEQCRKAPHAELLLVVRDMPMGGIHLAELLQRQSIQHRRLLTLAVTLPFLLVLANGSSWVTAHLGPFLANVAAGIVSGVLTIWLPKLAAWMGWRQ